MANFTYLPTRGSLASWVTGTVVTGAEFWFFESSIVKCPNFAEGGTYAPSNPIIIGGSGIKVTGLTWCTGYTRLDGNVDIGLGSSQNLVVSAVSTFVGNATHTGNLTCSAASNFNANGYAGLNGNVDIGNSSANECLISSTTQITGPLTASGNIYPTGTVRAPLTFGTGGYIKRRWIRLTANPGSDKTVSVVDYDQVLMAVVADVVLTDDGDDGAIIHVVNQTSASITVKNTSGSPIMILSSQGSRAGFMRRAAADLRWDVV